MHFIDTIILVQSDAGVKIGSFSLKLGSVVSPLFFLTVHKKETGGKSIYTSIHCHVGAICWLLMCKN